MPRALGIVGCGFVGEAIVRAAREQGRRVWGTTRRPERMAELEALGVTPVLLEGEGLPKLQDSDVVVTHPPDPGMDLRLCEALKEGNRCIYVSSTAVYGEAGGRVDDGVVAVPADVRGERRLEAERRYREAGAVALRAPGIYGPSRGVHRRLQAGSFRLTGDGSHVLSRIHVDDLATLCLAGLHMGGAGAAHAVGDLSPCPQLELVQWLCDRLGLPLPPSEPPDEAHPSLRGNRRVDPRAALSALGVELRFPNYRAGYADVLEREGGDRATRP